jgi:hypothetical protein
MFRALLIASALGGLMAVSGCAGGYVEARATVPAPELAYVAPGVYVVADYDRPVFYSNGNYWLYRNGLWFRSSIHTGDWVRARRVPVAVRRIDRPHAAGALLLRAVGRESLFPSANASS